MMTWTIKDLSRCGLAGAGRCDETVLTIKPSAERVSFIVQLRGKGSKHWHPHYRHHRLILDYCSCLTKFLRLLLQILVLDSPSVALGGLLHSLEVTVESISPTGQQAIGTFIQPALIAGASLASTASQCVCGAGRSSVELTALDGTYPYHYNGSIATLAAFPPPPPEHHWWDDVNVKSAGFIGGVAAGGAAFVLIIAGVIVASQRRARDRKERARAREAAILAAAARGQKVTTPRDDVLVDSQSPQAGTAGAGGGGNKQRYGFPGQATGAMVGGKAKTSIAPRAIDQQAAGETSAGQEQQVQRPASGLSSSNGASAPSIRSPDASNTRHRDRVGTYGQQQQQMKSAAGVAIVAAAGSSGGSGMEAGRSKVTAAHQGHRGE